MWTMHLEDTLFSVLAYASANVHLSLEAKTEGKWMRPCKGEVYGTSSPGLHCLLYGRSEELVLTSDDPSFEGVYSHLSSVVSLPLSCKDY